MVKKYNEKWVTIGFKVPYSQKIDLKAQSKELGFATISDYLRFCVLEKSENNVESLKESRTLESNDNLLSGDELISKIQLDIIQIREFSEACSGVLVTTGLLLYLFLKN